MHEVRKRQDANSNTHTNPNANQASLESTGVQIMYLISEYSTLNILVRMLSGPECNWSDIVNDFPKTIERFMSQFIQDGKSNQEIINDLWSAYCTAVSDLGTTTATIDQFGNASEFMKSYINTEEYLNAQKEEM